MLSKVGFGLVGGGPNPSESFRRKREKSGQNGGFGGGDGQTGGVIGARWWCGISLFSQEKREKRTGPPDGSGGPEWGRERFVVRSSLEAKLPETKPSLFFAANDHGVAEPQSSIRSSEAISRMRDIPSFVTKIRLRSMAWAAIHKSFSWMPSTLAVTGSTNSSGRRPFVRLSLGAYFSGAWRGDRRRSWLWSGKRSGEAALERTV